MTDPVPAAAVEARMRALARPMLRAAVILVPLLCVAGLAWIAADAWSRRVPLLTPRHRAEALCFALAAPPPFTPPMAVEPGAALVRGRFGAATPAAMALRQAMRFDDPMVLSERTERVGDFDVTTLWLRVPSDRTARHWLVAGWMEGSDLAVCTFRFGGTTDELTPDEHRWGDALLARALVRENFQAAALPAVRLRASRDGTLPVFGPKPAG